MGVQGGGRRMEVGLGWMSINDGGWRWEFREAVFEDAGFENKS